MKQESEFQVLVGAVLCAALILMGFTTKSISPRLQQKLHEAVQHTYGLDVFTLENMVIETSLNAKTAVEFGKENLFKIKQDDRLVGYAYLGQAPSMKDVFDYVVLFDPELAVKKLKVLIYREDYGRQIGSQRWLQQFIGKKSGEHLEYGKDVDAISGATISAKSMTEATKQVLESMAILKAENVF